MVQSPSIEAANSHPTKKKPAKHTEDKALEETSCTCRKMERYDFVYQTFYPDTLINIDAIIKM